MTREERWARVLLLDQLAGCASDTHDLDTAQYDRMPGEQPGHSARFRPSEALAWTDELAPVPAATRAAAQQLADELLEAAGQASRG